jgi:RNA polymerase subunit RPABC4/transcription elongation factor Spt4
MAKKTKQEAPQLYTCRDCAYSYGRYNANWEGELIMCKCEHSEFSKLLSGKQCDKFKLKQE